MVSATAIRRDAPTAETVHFSRGVPPADLIPVDAIQEIAKDIADKERDSVFQYAPLGGYLGDPRLRAGIGERYGADPHTVFIGNGSLQLLVLVAQQLYTPDRPCVLVETPTYDRALTIFRRLGAKIVSCPLEADGPDIGLFADRIRKHSPSFVYLIPDFQNPSGVTTSLTKRRKILDLAEETGTPIIEDSPYRDLRYGGAQVPLMRGLGSECEVVTISSLSKTLSPGLRIGFLLAGEARLRKLAEAAENTYLSPPPLTQAIAAECLSAGLLEQNIDLVKAAITPRWRSAVAVMRTIFGDNLLAETEGGYFMSVRVAFEGDETALQDALGKRGVFISKGSAFLPEDDPLRDSHLFLRLPFHALSQTRFSEGLSSVSATLKQFE